MGLLDMLKNWPDIVENKNSTTGTKKDESKNMVTKNTDKIDDKDKLSASELDNVVAGVHKDVSNTENVTYDQTQMDEIVDIDPKTGETIRKFIPKKVFKKQVNKKLSIILIENTNQVVKISDKVTKIVQSLANDGYLYVINYGSQIRSSGPIEVSKYEYKSLISNDDIGDFACLYDALMNLYEVYDEYYLKTFETETEKIRVDQIEIIGIGQCIENCSIVEKDIVLNCLDLILKNPKITTKYFCLSDNSFINAATIGFRSIGAIYRNYL